MEIKKLLTDDEAVSPVIGVILMVAITVILAAVIASFVLGLGQNQETSPTASFGFTYDASNDTDSAGGTVEISVKSSDPAIDPARLSIEGDSINGDSNGYPATWKTAHTNSNTKVGAGQSTTVGVDGDDWVIKLVWTKGDTSTVLREESGEGA